MATAHAQAWAQNSAYRPAGTITSSPNRRPSSAGRANASTKPAGARKDRENYFFAPLVADFCCCFCLFVFCVFFGLLSPTCCLLLSRFVRLSPPSAAPV